MVATTRQFSLGTVYWLIGCRISCVGEAWPCPRVDCAALCPALLASSLPRAPSQPIGLWVAPWLFPSTVRCTAITGDGVC